MISFNTDTDIKIAALTILVLIAIFILLLIVNVKIIKSKRGWLVITLAILFFAIEVFGHFVDERWFQIIRRSIGIANALLYPLGIYLIYLDYKMVK